MTKYIISAILALCAVTIMAQEQDHSEYLNYVGEADKAIEEGRWYDAAAHLESAMRLEPGNPTNVLLMSNLGLVRLNAGEDSLALAILNDAHRIAPTSVIVLNNRAKVLQAMGRTSEAYNDYSLIIGIDSTAIEPRFMHGIMSVYSGDTITAKKDFAVLQTLAPDSESTAIGLAALYTATNRPLDAIIQYTKLINKNPDIEYYSGRAACYLLTEQLNDAAADIAEGLRINPNDAEFYLYRAYLNKLRYRAEDAEADLKQALKLGADPNRAKLFYKLGK